MWDPDKNYSKEELVIVRELEYDLFMANPGFRGMWHDDFEEYFKGTLDEEYWNKRDQEREKEIEESVRRGMIEDPNYASWRNELAMIEDAIFKSYADPILSRGRKFELSRIEQEYERPDYEKDPLYILAKKWSRDASQKFYQFYEETKLLPAFRIAINAHYVASKIVFASGSFHDEDEVELEWRTDRIGYTLSLLCLNRCLDSLAELKQNDLVNFQKRGSDIRQVLIDRLEDIEQLRFKRFISR